MSCAGVIPGTVIACGEDGNYCSDECLLRGKLAVGARIYVTFLGDTVEAWVSLASKNRRSLILTFHDAVLGGYVEQMPVLADDNGNYHDLLRGEPVTIILAEDRN